MKARTEDSTTHVRRCHVCGAVNELENQAVHRCSDCGKHLAPFYYFDESQVSGYDANGFYWSRHDEFDPFSVVENYRPLFGLSTYW